VVSQPPNLARRVVNGSGELVYRNWEDPSDSRIIYVYNHGALHRLGTRDDGFPISYARAVTFRPEQDPRNARFEVIETYDANAQRMLTRRQDARGRVETLVRDTRTRAVTKVDLPDNTSVQATYNEFRQPLRVTDRLSRVVAREYDARGNVRSRIVAADTPAEATWRTDYNSRGQPLHNIDANGRRTDFIYDTDGRLAIVIEPPDEPGGPRANTAFVYDRAGRLSRRTDPERRTVRFEYDRRNRTTAIHHPDGSAEGFQFGKGISGNLILEFRDRNGNRETFEYDDTKRLTKKTRAAGRPEEVSDVYSYVPGTSLAARLVSRGERTDFERDGRNRLTATVVHLPGGRTLQSSMTYDVLDRLIESTDPYGRSTFRVYDANDRVVRTVMELVPGGVPRGANLARLERDRSANPAHTIDDVVFDGMGQTKKTINGRGVTTAFEYDGQGRQTKQVEAAGTAVEATTRRVFDDNGNVIRVTHPRTLTEGRPFITTYTYTGRDLLHSTTEAAGRDEEATTKTRYTLAAQPAETTDGRGNVTRFRYDSCCNRLTEIVDPTGAVTRYEYDAHGNRTSTIDPNGNETRTTYDGLYRQTSETNGQGETTRSEYDDDLTDGHGLDHRFRAAIRDLGFGDRADGAASLQVNPENETTLNVLDSQGRALRTVNSSGNATTMTYDLVVRGLVETARIDALGHVWREHHDGAGKLRKQIDPEGHVASSSFDASGNLVVLRDASGVGEDCAFDARNRSTSCRDTNGDTRQTRYDAHSNPTAVIDGLGAQTTTRYDARNRKVRSTDRVGGTTHFEYDRDSNLVRAVDAEGNATGYEYDARNMKLREIFPASHGGPDIRTMTFDPGRRLSSRTDQSGTTTIYEYDRADRLIRRRYPDRLDDRFAYDRASRITSAHSLRFGTVVERGYDRGGRLTVEEQHVLGEAYTVRYAYDQDDRKTQVTYPDGSVVHRTFTSRDQLQTVALGRSLVASRVYDPAMRLSETRLGNGVVERRAYRRDGLLAELDAAGVVTFSYSYDANKWKQHERVPTATVEGQVFRYDAEGRLSSWRRDGVANQTWNLSLVGDWRETTRDGNRQVRTHNPVHELTSVDGAALTYDSKGNLTRDDSGARYSWDFENRLLEARRRDGPEIRYFYDALGRRLAKTMPTKKMVFVHDGDQVVVEYENRRLARRYVYGSYVDEPLALFTDDGPFFYTSNHLYSSAALTDGGRRVVERYRYDAYGSRAVLNEHWMARAESAVGNQLGFAGRYHDADSTLVDFRKRQYDPDLGRFIGRDQSYVDGMSLYAAYFVPNATDPTGEETACPNPQAPSLKESQSQISQPFTSSSGYTSIGYSAFVVGGGLGTRFPINRDVGGTGGGASGGGAVWGGSSPTGAGQTGSSGTLVPGTGGGGGAGCPKPVLQLVPTDPLEAEYRCVVFSIIDADQMSQQYQRGTLRGVENVMMRSTGGATYGGKLVSRKVDRFRVFLYASHGSSAVENSTSVHVRLGDLRRHYPTTLGRRPVTIERILAHEFAHAIMGANHLDARTRYENPILKELDRANVDKSRDGLCEPWETTGDCRSQPQ